MITLLASSLASAQEEGPKYTVSEHLRLVDDDILLIEGGDYRIDEVWFASPLDGALKDATAPEVRLWVVREGPLGIIEDHVVTDQPLTLVVGTGEDVSLWASANESDGGLLRVGAFGGSIQSCVSPDGQVGSAIQADWTASSRDRDPADDRLSTWLLAAMAFPMPPNRCPIGWTFAGFDGEFFAEAENLAGQVSRTATVTIVHQ